MPGEKAKPRATRNGQAGNALTSLRGRRSRAAGDFRISTEPTGAGHNPSPPLGWTAGGGIEYLITDAISAKVEYLYVNLGTVSCPQGAVCSIDNPDASNGSVSLA